MKRAEVTRLLEILGGSRPVPETWAERSWIALARGVWWVVLLGLAFAFAGRTAKFVYVDF